MQLQSGEQPFVAAPHCLSLTLAWSGKQLPRATQLQRGGQPFVAMPCCFRAMQLPSATHLLWGWGLLSHAMVPQEAGFWSGFMMGVGWLASPLPPAQQLVLLPLHLLRSATGSDIRFFLSVQYFISVYFPAHLLQNSFSGLDGRGLTGK